jgi:hypothetical protein
MNNLSGRLRGPSGLYFKTYVTEAHIIRGYAQKESGILNFCKKKSPNSKTPGRRTRVFAFFTPAREKRD